MQINLVNYQLIYLMVLLIVTFFVWSGFMQIESAVISQGTVVTSEHRKVVTHYEGGVIEAIYVDVGDKVTEGQKLMAIDNLSIGERSKKNEINLESLSAKLERLKAEVSGAQTFKADKQSPYQQKEAVAFNARKQELDIKIAIIQDKIRQKKIDLDNIKEKKTHLIKQQKILTQQYELLTELVAQEAASLNMLLEKESSLVSVDQQLSEVNYAVSRYGVEMDELHKKIEFEKGQYLLTAKEEYDEVFGAFEDTENQLSVSKKRQDRSLLISTHAGEVFKIYANTLGETVKSGQVLIEIVPDTQKLVVKSKILAEDRAKIWHGMMARVSPVFKDFSSQPIEAEVVQVSADSYYDEVERRRYFDVLVESDSFVKDKHKFISSGMMVDVSVVTGKHRLLEYLLRPLLRGWDKMFVESL